MYRHMLVAAAIGMRCYADAVRTPAEFDFTHFETTIMQVLHLSRLLDPTAAPAKLDSNHEERKRKWRLLLATTTITKGVA
eukprot:gene27844-34686_t